MMHRLHTYIYIAACVLLVAVPRQAAAQNVTAARTAAAAVIYTAADSSLVCRLLAEARRERPACLPLFFARAFIGRPYVAHTLELYPDDERLIVNTRQLDCTTLVETVTALTLCASRQKYSFADYLSLLRQLRYRQGIIDGYPSRLHYFSDWILDNTRLHLVSEVQQPSPFTAVQVLKLGYMTTHPDAYVQLKGHNALVRQIAEQERSLRGRRFRYIPKLQVLDTPAMRQAVHDGDIIAITTSKAGLDIAHLGFAFWQPDGLHLLNASMIHKKVVAEPMTLGRYLSKHPSHTGIRVIRIEQ